LVGLTHPDGELALAQGAAIQGIHYSPSTYTSVSYTKITEGHAAVANHQSSLFFQLYVNADKEKTIKVIQEARGLKFKGLFITVDTPYVGNRDQDRRQKAQEAFKLGLVEKPAIVTGEKIVAGGNNGGLSRSLNWNDLKWIREAWGGPIALKGIQSAADAKLAMEAGVEAIYLSNHGGRQLHSAPSCLSTLLQIHKTCPEVFKHCQIYVDGGATRGGDILKAICLGATAVGIGRPFLYAIGAYGVDGLNKAVESKYSRSWRC
jgi:L-lactate dehydrogenase (cytochrome)